MRALHIKPEVFLIKTAIHHTNALCGNMVRVYQGVFDGIGYSNDVSHAFVPNDMLIFLFFHGIGGTAIGN